MCFYTVTVTVTKNIGTLSSLTYLERLDVLHAESLELRRLKCDLTMLFCIIHGYCALDRSSFLHCITLIREVIIIIIMWLVQSWTLPFLRACSMPVDSALGGRRLLAQC